MNRSAGEFISRRAAIEALRKCSAIETDIDATLIDKAEAMMEIMMLPPADRESGRSDD